MKFKLQCHRIGAIFAFLFLILLLLEKNIIRKKAALSTFWNKVLEKRQGNAGFYTEPHKTKEQHLLEISPYCPEISAALKGNLELNLRNITSRSFEEIAFSNPALRNGGTFVPSSCKALNRVAIIIPLRGREYHLRGLLGHMHPVWQRQNIDYTVYTITQTGTELFNRGKLLNIGFREACKDREYDCYVFHDADILLENDKCLYTCPGKKSQVKHISAYLNKFNYTLRKYEAKCLPEEYPFGEIVNFGGIVLMTREQFENVNGFSNLYWGWGGEDDDMAMRVWNKGYNVVRSEHCRHSMFEHIHADKNTIRNLIWNISLIRQDTEGLNSLSYRVLGFELNPTHTNITVDLGAPNKKLIRARRTLKKRRNCDGREFLGIK